MFTKPKCPAKVFHETNRNEIGQPLEYFFLDIDESHLELSLDEQ